MCLSKICVLLVLLAQIYASAEGQELANAVTPDQQQNLDVKKLEEENARLRVYLQVKDEIFQAAETAKNQADAKTKADLAEAEAKKNAALAAAKVEEAERRREQEASKTRRMSKPHEESGQDGMMAGFWISGNMFEKILSILRRENLFKWWLQWRGENDHTQAQADQMHKDAKEVHTLEIIVDAVKVVVVCVSIVAVIYRKTSTVTKNEDIKSNKTWNSVVILGTGLYMLYSEQYWIPGALTVIIVVQPLGEQGAWSLFGVWVVQTLAIVLAYYCYDGDNCTDWVYAKQEYVASVCAGLIGLFYYIGPVVKGIVRVLPKKPVEKNLRPHSPMSTAAFRAPVDHSTHYHIQSIHMNQPSGDGVKAQSAVDEHRSVSPVLDSLLTRFNVPSTGPRAAGSDISDTLSFHSFGETSSFHSVDSSDDVDNAPLHDSAEQLRIRQSYVGKRVWKEFPPYGWFGGTITAYCDISENYHMLYEDEDVEVLPYSETMEILVNTSSDARKRNRDGEPVQKTGMSAIPKPTQDSAVPLSAGPVSAPVAKPSWPVSCSATGHDPKNLFFFNCIMYVITGPAHDKIRDIIKNNIREQICRMASNYNKAVTTSGHLMCVGRDDDGRDCKKQLLNHSAFSLLGLCTTCLRKKCKKDQELSFLYVTKSLNKKDLAIFKATFDSAEQKDAAIQQAQFDQQSRFFCWDSPASRV